MSRNKSIEMWRLVFTFSIVFNHTMLLPWYRMDRNYLWCSPLGVEFFFILSGYLMAKSAEKEENGISIGESTWRFLIRKAKSLYPTYLFAGIFDALIALFVRGDAQPRQYWHFLWDLLFIKTTGVGSFDEPMVGASWYLSAMMVGMAILYPILKKHRDTFLHLFSPLLAVFLCGWFSVQKGNMNYAFDFENGICLGLLRAIACMSAGCFCFLISEKIRTGYFKKDLSPVIWTLLEVLPMTGVLFIATHSKRNQTDFLAVFLLCVGVVAGFSGKSVTETVLRKMNVSWISEFSLALYLNHYVWVRTIRVWNCPIPWQWEAVALLALSICTAWLCMNTLKLIRTVKAVRTTQ